MLIINKLRILITFVHFSDRWREALVVVFQGNFEKCPLKGIGMETAQKLKVKTENDTLDSCS